MSQCIICEIQVQVDKSAFCSTKCMLKYFTANKVKEIGSSANKQDNLYLKRQILDLKKQIAKLQYSKAMKFLKEWNEECHLCGEQLYPVSEYDDRQIHTECYSIHCANFEDQLKENKEWSSDILEVEIRKEE